MKKILLLILFIPALAMGQKVELEVGKNAHYEVKIHTSEGVVDVELYNETPLHRDNFIKLAKSGFYDNIIFHRVIKEFMIQAGDPQSKNSSAIAHYGDSDSGYKLPAEITDKFFHKKGALAAAREPDEFNPEKMSSGSQFYIVVGKVFTDSTLNKVKQILERTKGHLPTAEREEYYKKTGGTPHLDGNYTIFGEVTSGMKTVEKISKTTTNRQDRPLEDIYIKKVEIKVVEDK